MGIEAKVLSDEEQQLLEARQILTSIVDHDRVYEDTGESYNRFRCVFCGRRGYSAETFTEHTDRCPIKHAEHFLYSIKRK